MTTATTPKAAGAYFYHKIDEPQRLHLHLPNAISPYLQVLTGGVHQRFLLVCPDAICHAGVVESDYGGVMILRHADATPTSPIHPISSADISRYQAHFPNADISADDQHRYWMQWYAKALLNSPHHFLTQGDYVIETARQGAQLELEGLAGDELTSHIDWWHWRDSENTPILLKCLPHPESGRVKWHKKLIAQGVDVPLLLWFLPHIQSYVLVDGHTRLTAHRALGSTRQLLTIDQYQTTDYPTDDKERGHILANLDKALQNGASFKTEQLNSILLNAYGGYRHEHPMLSAQPIAEMDALWLRIVECLSRQAGVDDDFIQDMYQAHLGAG